MKTRQEIIDYLGLEESYEHIDELVSTASEIERKYEWELKCKTHGYGLACDFESMPDILEDPEYCEIKKIETINGITVYEILNTEGIKMKKVKVYIEEHLCKEIEIEVPDNLNVDERIELAEEKAREMYRNEEIILTSDDYTTTLICVFDMETEISTEWDEI